MNISDNINDLFKDVKERFRSPFFSAFIFAWVIINWQVIIALIWYNSNDLKALGCSNYVDYIKANVTNWTGLIYPLLSAIGYCIAFPIIKNAVAIYNAFSRTWGSNAVYKYAKDGKVGMDIYMSLKDNYDARTKLLEDIIAENKKEKGIYETTKTQILQANQELEVVKGEWKKSEEMLTFHKNEVTLKENELKEWKKEIKDFYGVWVIKKFDRNTNINNSIRLSRNANTTDLLDEWVIIERWVINNNEAIIKDINNGTTIKLSIIYFQFKPNQNGFFMLLEKGDFHRFLLMKKDAEGIYIGRYDEKIEMRFEKGV